MSAQRRTEQRRRALRPVGPAVLELVDSLKPEEREIVEVRLSARLAAAIAAIDARDAAPLHRPEGQPTQAGPAAIVAVERPTAERWAAQAWRAVGEGLVAAAEAQALSDQLAPRGAA
jgi:hypothetical protein